MAKKQRGSKTVRVRMADRDLAALNHTAERLGLSKSDIVRRALFVALPCFEDIQLPKRDHREGAQPE